MNGEVSKDYEEFNLDGFQVVRSEMFSRRPYMLEPVCTIWPNKIAFSKSCVKALSACEYVRFEVNANTKGLLVVPCSSKDDDSIKWIKGAKDPCVRNLQSAEFGAQLYKAWQLDENYVYRAPGRLVLVKQKVFLFFDFSHAEQWQGKRD